LTVVEENSFKFNRFSRTSSKNKGGHYLRTW